MRGNCPVEEVFCPTLVKKGRYPRQLPSCITIKKLEFLGLSQLLLCQGLVHIPTWLRPL